MVRCCLQKNSAALLPWLWRSILMALLLLDFLSPTLLICPAYKGERRRGCVYTNPSVTSQPYTQLNLPACLPACLS
ncbi:hypothetical protein GGS21DRAFT_534234 [Xylaria nigripes]|nr:hypothetical protein GGS21DRAFT_534234 [Xylaria nigripes]